jgi:hypothetical protein
MLAQPKGEDNMRIKTGMLFTAIAAALMLYVAGCIVAEPQSQYRGGYADSDYYYYPDEEVYFYPNVGFYYWYEGGSWHHDRRPPARYVLREQERVRIRWNREPHLDHDRIRRDYPARRDDRNRDRDRDREKERPRY